MAIIQLLIAFNVPQATVNNVQGILQKAGHQTQVVTDQTVTPQGIGGVGTVPTENYVNLKINGEDISSIEVPKNAQGKAVVIASWEANKVNFPGCSLSRADVGDVLKTHLDPTGSQQVAILKDTTLKIECLTDTGTTTDSVLVKLIP